MAKRTGSSDMSAVRADHRWNLRPFLKVGEHCHKIKFWGSTHDPVLFKMCSCAKGY